MTTADSGPGPARLRRAVPLRTRQRLVGARDRVLGPPAVPLRDALPVAVDGRHNAFPHAVRLPSGSVLAAWRHSSGHLRADGVVQVARSDDDGATWTPPTTLVGTTDLRDPSMTVLSDGRVLLSAFDFDGERSTGVQVRLSTDGGAAFGPPVPVPDAWSGWTAVSGPAVELPGGDLLLALYGREPGERPGTRLVRSLDGGATWQHDGELLSGTLTDDDQLEPWLLDIGDRLVCLLRSGTTVVRRLESSDGGRTWTPAAALFRSHSRVSAGVLADGHSVAVYRSVRDRSVVARWSTDGWRSWGPELPVHDGGLGTYAGVVDAPDGAALAIYALESRDRSVGHVLARVLSRPV